MRHIPLIPKWESEQHDPKHTSKQASKQARKQTNKHTNKNNTASSLQSVQDSALSTQQRAVSVARANQSKCLTVLGSVQRRAGQCMYILTLPLDSESVWIRLANHVQQTTCRKVCKNTQYVVECANAKVKMTSSAHLLQNFSDAFNTAVLSQRIKKRSRCSHSISATARWSA